MRYLLSGCLYLRAICLLICVSNALTMRAEADETIDLVGEPLVAAPYFNYVDEIMAGSAVTIAFPCPGSVPVCDVYVVAAKTATQWKTDPTLTDVRSYGAEASAVFTQENDLCVLQLRQGSLLDGDAGCLPSSAGCIGVGLPYDVVLDCDQGGVAFVL
jgi:hypothetical protein